MVRVLIYLAAVMTLFACSERPVEPEFADTAEVQAFMADAAAVARGQAIFEGSCASFCHANELEASFLFDCTGITAPAIRIFSTPSPVA